MGAVINEDASFYSIPPDVTGSQIAWLESVQGVPATLGIKISYPI
jgi:hypothetical protein